jgi:beta-lactamase superfamily II metal-dependent hydrolase
MKKLITILLMLAMTLTAASAEIFFIDDETQLPEGWQEKELFRLTAIDTDRSDAMLLQCGGENMMIDGGSVQYYPRLEEYFDANGITAFKYLLNTHPDNDHLQGLTKMMNHRLTAEDGKTDIGPKYQIGGFYTAVKKDYKNTSYHEAAVRAVNKYEIPYVQVFGGDVLTLGNATINVFRCEESWGANARSACTQIVFGDSKVLLMGDCDSRPQKYFLKNVDHSLLECDILKAVHHGINGFEENFLEAADPEFIFIPNYKSHASIKSGTKRKFAEYNALYSGEGSVIMETDGTDWYIWQLSNYKKNK